MVRLALEELKLRGESDHDRLAGHGPQGVGGEAAPEREDELRVQPVAGGGDLPEYLVEAVLQGPHRRVDERPAIEPLPGKLDGAAGAGIDERAGVMQAGDSVFARKIESRGRLRHLSEGGGEIVGMRAREGPRRGVARSPF